MKCSLRPLLVIAFLLASFSFAAAGSYSLRRTIPESPLKVPQVTQPVEPGVKPIAFSPAKDYIRLGSGVGAPAVSQPPQVHSVRRVHDVRSIGPIPYTSLADSPFSDSVQAGNTEFEDFEDGLLNIAGVTASTGTVVGPGGLTDSVDADDGSIDGSGTNGHDLFASPGSAGITFTFSPDASGQLPIRAGIVWTDGAGTTTFQAFDSSNTLIASINGNSADGSILGTTAEDRFYGVVSPAGIAKISISNTAGGIEVDHLQVGYIPQVAIVRNFASSEIDTLQTYLTEVGYDSLVFDQGALAASKVTGFDLIIWDDLGFAIGGLTDADVTVFNAAFQANVPLYLIGDDLSIEQAGLTSTNAGIWRDITHFNAGSSNGNGRSDVSIVNTAHPVTGGPFGVIQDFTYGLDMDRTTRTITGEVLLAQSGTDPIVLAAPANASYRYVSQLADVTSGSGTELKKLFQNAATWLVGRQLVSPPIVVTTVDDVVNASDGVTSLREAINTANSTSGAQTIEFNIPGTGVQTIAPATTLPNLTDDGTTIDATTQPGYAGTPLIAIAPVSAAGGQTLGLIINGSNCVVRGLALNANFANIRIRGVNASNNTVRDCYIGLNADGTAAVPCFKGIDLAAGAKNNHIGVAGGVNVISGNDIGVSIMDVGTTGNLVQANLIGTSPSGISSMPNQRGVWIQNGATGNVVGGNTAGLGNVISGNSFNGVDISGAGTDNNRVLGNIIGLNSTGAQLGNGTFGDGVLIEAGARSNRVGGTSAGARNVISGNNGTGVSIDGAGTNRNLVQGNYIGLNQAGTAAIANSRGVRMTNGAKNNVIGGTTAAYRNIISGCEFGVGLGAAETTGNQIQGNFIGTDATGSFAVPNGYGIGISDANNNTIGGNGGGTRNLISGNVNANILFSGGSGNIVAGNFIGTNLSGTASFGNFTTTAGVWLTDGANANVIGGTQAGEKNVISGHAGIGLLIQGRGSGTGPLSFGNFVKGNYIGTDKTGTLAVPNQNNGLVIEGGAHDNVIGGTVSGARNLISGNLARGIYISDTGTDNNKVRGNYIGTDAAGTAAIPNQFDGISIVFGASNNVIGGTVSGAGNLVSGNLISGISLEEDNTTGNVVQGNRIGVPATGTAALPNTRGSQEGWGVVVIAADDSVIGGSGLAANIIAHNDGPGIALLNQRGTTNGTLISGNRIFQNGGLGIDLGGDGATANDTGDGDTGANGLQNFPIITSANISSSQTSIDGTFNSRPNRAYRLEFFSSSSADPSGFGEGNRFIGAQSVTTNGSGDASFTANLSGAATGSVITATATDTVTNETSEFSAAFTASAISLQLLLPTTVNEGDSSTLTGTVTRNGVATTNALRVDLSALPTSQLNLPVSVTIPAGATSQTFNFTIVNDAVAEVSPLAVTVTGMASGFPNATAVVNVIDDDSAGGELLAWGYNEFGQVGDNSTTNRAVPVLVPLSNVRTVSANGSHSLALMGDGTVRAWGYNGGGQLGDGTQTDRSQPVAVSGLTNVAAVAAGWYHSLALRGDGTVWAWGYNKFGQIGDGTTLRRLRPVQVVGLTRVRAIAAGVYFSLAVKTDGTVWAWGNNFYGQLGDGTHNDSLVPRQVPGLTGVIAVAAGGGHSLFLKTDGTVWASGWNTYGQLGNETLTDSAIPVQCFRLTGATAISAGYAHSLAANTTGNALGWGDNSYGQLGTSVLHLVSQPVTLPGLSGVSDVEAGASFSLFLLQNGLIRDMGANDLGQLGIGSFSANVSTPQTPSLGQVTGASAGYGHGLAISVFSGGGLKKASGESF
jgi:alpha-tubulin suppressor-like RCC1 family protein